MSQWMRIKSTLAPLMQWHERQVVNGRVAMILGMVLIGGVAFGLGRWIGVGAADAQPPQIKAPSYKPGGPTPGYDSEYEGRVVAYVNGNVPITRVELAEYLIARFGAQRLEFLVNRKIVETACQARGIFVTDAEVEDQFRRDLIAFGPHMNAQMFQDQILKRYNKTIFEWKEDVIRPKLAITKLVQADVQVTDNDVRKQFDIMYGPKVQCRMIIFKDGPTARRVWERIRSSENPAEAFIVEAKQQFIAELASKAGELPPIHKHFGDPRIEKEAYMLKPGEMSQLFGMPDGTTLVIMCQKHVPPDTTKSYDTERQILLPQVRELIVAEKVQQKVVELRKDAAPRFLLARHPSDSQIQRDAQSEMQADQPPFRAVDKR